jgi:hypothetical protein
MRRDRSSGMLAAVLGLLGLVMLGLNFYATHPVPHP